MRYTLVQLSDIHTGAPYRPEVAHALIEASHALHPTLTIIAGDLVQRAEFRSQWQAALDLLHRLPQPQLVIPGNHDIPFFNGIRRLLTPLKYYYRYVDTNLNPVFQMPGLAVVGGNTAQGFSLSEGYLYKQQRTAIQAVWSQITDPSVFRVMVLHHPLINPPIAHRADRIRNARAVFGLLRDCGVDLYVSGHMHFAYVAALDEHGAVLPIEQSDRRSMLVAQSGTATSRRGRAPHQGRNSFNVIELDDEYITIVTYYYLAGRQQFAPMDEYIFRRHTQPAAIYR